MTLRQTMPNLIEPSVVLVIFLIQLPQVVLRGSCLGGQCHGLNFGRVVTGLIIEFESAKWSVRPHDCHACAVLLRRISRRHTLCLFDTPFNELSLGCQWQKCVECMCQRIASCSTLSQSNDRRSTSEATRFAAAIASGACSMSSSTIVLRSQRSKEFKLTLSQSPCATDWNTKASGSSSTLSPKEVGKARPSMMWLIALANGTSLINAQGRSNADNHRLK